MGETKTEETTVTLPYSIQNVLDQFPEEEKKPRRTLQRTEAPLSQAFLKAGITGLIPLFLAIALVVTGNSNWILVVVFSFTTVVAFVDTLYQFRRPVKSSAELEREVQVGKYADEVLQPALEANTQLSKIACHYLALKLIANGSAKEFGPLPHSTDYVHYKLYIDGDRLNIKSEISPASF